MACFFFFCCYFFYVFLLAKQECWAVSIRLCEGNDIFCAHTPPAAHKDEIGPHFFFLPPISLPLLMFFSHPITLLLPSAQCKLHSHFFPSPTTVTHIYPHPLLHPPTHSPGCHSNSVGGEHHYCFTPFCNHTPRPLPASPPITSVRPTRPIAAYPTPAGRPQSLANGICCFLRHSRGCKAAQQQWGVKKERS